MKIVSILIFFIIYAIPGLSQKGKEGIVRIQTYFYSLDGKRTTFVDTSYIWYKDSTTIQEFHRSHRDTDPKGKVTIYFTPLMNRYIDLRKKEWYNYVHLSDTAQIVAKGNLPDTLFKDYGWSYFSEKSMQIAIEPVLLSDTVINNMAYKRARFYEIFDDPSKFYQIGLFRCDGMGLLFSLEKKFSRKMGCTMTKLFSYRVGHSTPYASLEVDYISDRLPSKMKKLFSVWEKKVR